MILGYTLCSTRTRHFVIEYDDVGYKLIGPFPTIQKAGKVASAKCAENGLGQLYVGVKKPAL